MGGCTNLSTGDPLPRMRDRRPRIFISYRRSDSAAIVGHIYERLSARYRQESVFRDINKMPLGKNFYDHIREELAGCDVVLVVIGPQWLSIDAQGQSRIQQADDPVRLEVEAALASGAIVIPVLVEGASIPTSADLPESLKAFPALAGTRVNVEDFDAHIERLSQSIDEILEKRGKSIAHFPIWALRAAAACGLGASVLLVGLVVLALFGGVPPLVGLLTVTVISLGFAIACGLVGGDAAAKRRVPLLACQRRPTAFSIASGALVFLFLLAISIYSPFLAGQITVDPISLASELRTAFTQARDNLERSGSADFSRAEALIEALKSIDQHNGHAWYFAGEIKRIQNHASFTTKSCLRGSPPGQIEGLEAYQQDFHRYLEEARSLPAIETSGDPGSEICYQRPKGYCAQRTYWIYHLLANDFYLLAMAQSDRRDRIQPLTRARQFVTEARKYRPTEGGEGFDQCIPTTILAEKIAEALEASREPTGGIQSRAR
jgi:TIR domain